MEVKDATFLYTLSGLMITFAGFSALLFGVRQAAGARLSVLDRFIAKNIMSYIFVLTAGALLPAILSLFSIQESRIWRASGLIFSIPMLFLQVTYPNRRRKVVGTGPPPAILAVFVVIGSAVTLAMLVFTLRMHAYSGAIYTTGVTLDFFTVVYSFVNALDIIMQQPVQIPDLP